MTRSNKILFAILLISAGLGLAASGIAAGLYQGKVERAALLARAVLAERSRDSTARLSAETIKALGDAEDYIRRIEAELELEKNLGIAKIQEWRYVSGMHARASVRCTLYGYANAAICGAAWGESGMSDFNGKFRLEPATSRKDIVLFLADMAYLNGWEDGDTSDVALE